jgi:hypothetical protein
MKFYANVNKNEMWDHENLHFWTMLQYFLRTQEFDHRFNKDQENVILSNVSSKVNELRVHLENGSKYVIIRFIKRLGFSQL